MYVISNVPSGITAPFWEQTRTTHMGYLDVSPGVGMRHLEGLKNPDGLNLGIRIHTHTPSYTSTRVENKEDTDNTPIFPSVKT